MNFKIFAETQRSQREQNLIVMLPLKHKTQLQYATFLPPAAHSHKYTSSTLPSSLPKLLLYFQLPFTKRASGHWLGTFRAVKCLSPVTVQNVMHFNTSPIFLLILLLRFLLLHASSLVHPFHSSTLAHV
jgi:hypothetical protein